MEILPGRRRAIEVAMSAFDRVLIIETAGRVGQVALAAGDAVVPKPASDEGRRRASDLALVVDRLLKEQGWAARDLTAVIVGLGPGSYTGLRVGLASAKALAYATGCRFFGVETFAAIAERASADVRRHFGRCRCVARETISPRLPTSGSRRMGTCEAARIVAASDWLATLRPDTWVSGPAAAHSRVDSRAVCVRSNAEEREPRAIDLLIAAKRYPWAVTTDMWTAEPFYLRGSSAEEKAALNARGPGTVEAAPQGPKRD